VHQLVIKNSDNSRMHGTNVKIIERNVCRCTFNRYSVITQFAKLDSSCVVVALIKSYGTSKPLKVSPEKSHILSCDTVVANERHITCFACASS